MQNGELAIVHPEASGELSVIQLKDQITKIQEVMKLAMHDGEHYGKIPGTDKPTLLKAGAEKLALVFRLAPAFDIKRSDLPNGHREFEVICRLTHIPTGRLLGEGVGSCSTMESKYRYRHAEPESTGNPVPKAYWKTREVNPAEASKLIGGADFTTKKIDGQWFIAKKSQERIENPDIADTYNTVLKMAKKRAQVDATLTVTAASDCFTQDLEEMREVRAKSSRETLWTAILDYCNDDKKGAGAILRTLCNKPKLAKLSELTEAEALSAIDRFKAEYEQKRPEFDVDLSEGGNAND